MSRERAVAARVERKVTNEESKSIDWEPEASKLEPTFTLQRDYKARQFKPTRCHGSSHYI